MLAFFSNILFALSTEAPAHSAPAAGATSYQQAIHWIDQWLNIPGFEAWKFLNLGIFILILVYLLRKPVTNAFKARREQIRAELIKAQQERDAAVKKLEDIEARLSMLDSEVAGIKERSQAEADAETARITAQTESDIAKMREQANNEILRAGNQAKTELRRFSAEESIRLAEEMLRQRVGGDTDANLIKAGIDKLGGLN
jgi:F0F1-type ATP synthase membrane subunit b/b'